VLIVQLVTLLRDGQPVRMSKRRGEYVLMEELLEEVGRDAARFTFLTRRHDSPLEFDLAVATRQSADNPVYYVQYAMRGCRACGRMLSSRRHGAAEFQDFGSLARSRSRRSSSAL
jgi:arginyl-tRNA synthetase